MKKIIYLLLISLVVFSIISCEDEKGNPDFVGMFGTYVKPHFELDYATDSVSIQMMPGKQKSIAVKDLKNMFLGMATEKMSTYFKGINFGLNHDLAIEMTLKDGTSSKMNAAYTYSNDHVQVTLNADEMKALMGDKAANIPPISFKYDLSGNQMTMYFDKVYIMVIYSMMEDQIAPMIVKMMGIDFSQMPEDMEEMIMKSVKDQLDDIIKKINKLEIGFILKLEAQNKQ